jgi:predicted membrane protein
MALIDLDEFYHHISIALILVTAFTWNEAFKHMFDSITFLKNRHFLYAIFITIIVTILLNVINYAQMLTNKELAETSPAKQDKENKNKGVNNIDMYGTYTYVME